MRNPALQERRNRQILADLVRTYIETGEPVSSRAISKGLQEMLSTATIRNVMADLEDGGYLYQPHTSAGRVPTAAACLGESRRCLRMSSRMVEPSMYSMTMKYVWPSSPQS